MLAFQKCLLWEATGGLPSAQSGKFHPQIRELRIVGCDCREIPQGQMFRAQSKPLPGSQGLFVYTLGNFSCIPVLMASVPSPL